MTIVEDIIYSNNNQPDGNPLIPSAFENDAWNNGTKAFDEGDFEIAAMHFRKLGLRSKPLYNVSICYLMLNDIDSASLRGNNTIDYGQLGLEACIYACELYFNMAACHTELCDRGAAVKALVSAHQYRCLVRHDIVDHALMSTNEQWPLFIPPEGKLFQMRAARRNQSLGSLRMLPNANLPAIAANNSRSIISAAEGEPSGNTTVFMEPLVEQGRQELVARADGLGEQHARRHSRSASLANSIKSTASHSSTTASAVLNCYLSKQSSSGIYSTLQSGLAKVYRMDPKANLNDYKAVVETRIISLEGIPTIHGLMNRIREKLNIRNIYLKYRDFENDLIVITDDSDVQAAYEMCCNGEVKSVKLILYCFTYDPASVTAGIAADDKETEVETSESTTEA